VIHETQRIKVWADVDVKIVSLVLALNEEPGIITIQSCQGTIGDVERDEYYPYVYCKADSEEALAAMMERFTVLRTPKKGPLSFYVMPPPDSVK